MPALTHHLNNFFTRPGTSLSPGAKIALAVSGGVDSMALLHLFHAWVKDKDLSAVVLTVDHGLRKESSDEAAFVTLEATALGFPHITLPWLGDKPTSGIQAAARAARYRLIEEFMTREGCDTLLTAHTRDDQAETVWMRLKRGTGIDGLAGMRAARKLPTGATHLRPLLDVAKSDLIQFMHNANKTWREDPSNQNQAFERVRVRDLQSEFDSLGITRENLARTAHRADQFVRYLDNAIENKIADAAGAITFHDLGFFAVTHTWFEALAPLEQVRLLSEMIGSVGGQTEPVPLGQLEDTVDSLTDADGRLRFSTARKNQQGFTLHGAHVDVGENKFRVYRETLDARTLLSALPNRLAAQPLTPGQVVVWDHRFAITLSDTASHGVTVGPLTESGLADLEARGWQRPNVPARVLWTLPVFRHNGLISAVAHNDLNTSPLAPSHCVVTRHRIPFLCAFADHDRQRANTKRIIELKAEVHKAQARKAAKK